MEKRLHERGFSYLGVELPKFSWRTRTLKTMEIAGEHPDKLLIFVDAWDTLPLGYAHELDGMRLDRGITFAAAKACWPDERYKDYDDKHSQRMVSPWRYLNSNPMAGLGSSISEAMQWTWKHFPLTGDSADTLTPDGEVCERFYTHLYLDSPFNTHLDMGCRLNQIYLCSQPGDLRIEDGRIHNLVTNSWPVFLHLNGKHTLDTGLFE